MSSDAFMNRAVFVLRQDKAVLQKILDKIIAGTLSIDPSTDKDGRDRKEVRIAELRADIAEIDAAIAKQEANR